VRPHVTVPLQQLQNEGNEDEEAWVEDEPDKLC
jgi:hypothetical protein